MSGCTLTDFAENLGDNARGELGRKVVDQTGLTGRYTLVIHWAGSDAGNSEPDTNWPSVFTAVKEQLGLELKPIRGPLDTIVIDHAEMPSEN